MKRVLFRADDLGYSEGINYGIAKSVNNGMIGGVGVMVNMPAATHGLKILERFDICFGQHTNICNGRPLTDPELIPSITGSNGEFKSSKEYRSAKEDFVVLDEVVLEIEAQYQKFVEIVGRKPQYFEGHAVASMNFFKGLEIVAERHKLKYSGIGPAGEPIKIGNTMVHITMESMNPGYEPLATLKRMVENAHEDAVDMMICHPGYLDGYILKHSSLTIPRPMEVDMLCDMQTKQYLEENGVKLVTYDAL